MPQSLRINVAAANNPAMDREIEMADAQFMGSGAGGGEFTADTPFVSGGGSFGSMGTGAGAGPGGGMGMGLGTGDQEWDSLGFDDEGLSALEKIYLFARSENSFHR